MTPVPCRRISENESGSTGESAGSTVLLLVLVLVLVLVVIMVLGAADSSWNLDHIWRRMVRTMWVTCGTVTCGTDTCGTYSVYLC